MVRRQNIIEDTFRFIKHRCIHCKGLMKHNILFCSKECKALYFEKMSKLKNGNWTGKQNKRQTGLQSILSEEFLKDMVKETEKSIDKQMNKSKR